MSTAKQATPDHPIHEMIARRWSPYGFTDRPVSEAELAENLSMPQSVRPAAATE